MNPTILVTGGTGYIGSHTCVELLAAGHEVVILDNLSNSRRSVLDRITRIAGRSVAFIEADIRDPQTLDTLFATHKISAVIHFAGLKAVGESVQAPLRYYDNNVAGTLAPVRGSRPCSARKCTASCSVPPPPSTVTPRSRHSTKNPR